MHLTTLTNTCNTRWEKTHDRIVGGYDTRENKPWAARIWFDEKHYLLSYLLDYKDSPGSTRRTICAAAV